MPKICYVDKNFRAETLSTIVMANAIIDEFTAQGYDLTLRQLYYQFVIRNILPNKNSEYSRLGVIISNARLAGLVDWDSIVDRTRAVREKPHWETPQEIVRACARQYAEDKWQHQSWRVEVWIEKDALLGVIAGVCSRLDVPYFSCRGYASQSSMWRAAKRLKAWESVGQRTLVLHLGDHDPSGIDMTRDIANRLNTFQSSAQVRRIALTMEQVDEHGPPPNPAKMTDSRAAIYVDEYGFDSWELDALEPAVLDGLIESAVLAVREDDLWFEAVDDEDSGRRTLNLLVNGWQEAIDYLEDPNEDP